MYVCYQLVFPIKSRKLSQNVVKFRFILNRVFLSGKTPYKANSLFDTTRLFGVKCI